MVEWKTYTLRRPLTMYCMKIKAPGAGPGPTSLKREFPPGEIEASMVHGLAVVAADDLVWACSEFAFMGAAGASAEDLYYCVLTSADSYNLARDVNDHICNGWKPIGGVALARTADGEMIYAQALVCEEKNLP